MTLISLRLKNPKATPVRAPLHEALGIAPGGASPRGSTYYKTFQMCPREFFIKYVLKWRALVPNDALTIGLLWHHCLEKYYRAIMVHQLQTPEQPSNPAWLWGGCNEGADEAYQALDTVQGSFGYPEIAGIVRVMFDNYLDAFDRRDRLRILAVEETLIYDAEDPYTCRADMIVEDFDRGGMWFWEHKSAASLTDNLLSAYDMDLQILGEWWLIDRVLDPEAYPDLRGVIVNITTKPKNPDSKAEVKMHRHEVCPSRGHVRSFERTIGTRKIMLEAAERAGWPQYFGNCSGATRGYSKCECYDLCQQYPDYDAARLLKADVADFPNYTRSEETVTAYDEQL